MTLLFRMPMPSSFFKRIAALTAVLGWSLTAHAQSAPAVIEAVKARDLDMAGELIEKGAAVNVPQGDGATALHWASHRNDLEAAALLIAGGADVNAANELGATPLWLAAINGSPVMVKKLLEAGANPNVSLKMGETPLMATARSGNVRTVEQLLEHGADIEAKEHGRGQTALMWAVAQQHADVARVLIRNGAGLDARTKVYYQLENTAGNTNPSGNFRMAHGGSSPLLFSARNGSVETAKVLVEAGADVNDAAASGTSALVVAAHSGHGPLAIYLLEQGADPNALVEHGTPGRRFSADYSIRAQLIGATAFWLAAKYGELEILRTLAERGANAHIVPKSGMSALQAAMGMPGGPLENRRDRTGKSPPDPAEEERLTFELGRFVLALGIDVNAADAAGNTALHHAVLKDFDSVVEFLVANGSDVNAENKRGQTPLVLAETPQSILGANSLKGTRPKVAALLRRLGAND